MAVAAALALASASPPRARAFPWSIDMFRGDAVAPMAQAPRVMPPDTLPLDGERPRSTAASRRLQNPLAAADGDVERGAKLYGVYCSVCHGPRGHGDGPVAFMLRTPPADLTSHRVTLMKDRSYGLMPEGYAWIMVRLDIHFRAELRWPGTIELGLGVSKFGRTSVSFDQVVFSAGQCVASARSVSVLLDEATRKPTPLTGEIIRNFKRWLLPGVTLPTRTS